MKLSLKTLLLGLILCCCDLALANEFEQKIAKVVDRYEHYQVFSGAVLVARQGKIVYQQGHGLANREWQSPNTPAVKFQIASMTKAFTAALVLKLVEQKQLSLSDTLGQYFPDIGEDKAGITLRQILEHSSGLPRAFTIPGWFKGKFNSAVSNRQFAEIIAQRDLLFTPGSARHYTNLGYFLLGMIIESATGKPYEQVLQQQIFNPLNMTDTGITHYSNIIKNRASGYRVSKHGGFKKPNYINIELFGAGAAMYSTVQDLFKWDRALYTNKLLTNKSKALLFGIENHYGWHVDKSEPNVVSTSGELPGFSSLMVRNTDSQDTVIILSNNAVNNAEKVRMAEDITAVLQGKPNSTNQLPISFYLNQALINGDLQQAIDNSQKTSQRYSYDQHALIAMGNQQMWSANHQNAIMLFKFCTEHFADSALAHSKLGDAYVENNQSEQALASFQKALELAPGNSGLKSKISGL